MKPLLLSLFNLFVHLSYGQILNDSLTQGAMVDPCIQAHFPGGQKALNSFMNKLLIYPDSSFTREKVYVEFIVDTTGKILNPKIKRGMYPKFNEEALRLIKLMPDWIPMKCNGVPQKTRMIQPVTFKIQ